MMVLLSEVQTCFRLDVLVEVAVVDTNSEDYGIQGIGVGKER